MRRLALVVALTLWTFRAEAHRLDEYLQQTLIELGPERVVLHVDLTPGVAVASRVVRSIDRDGDRSLSAVEQYAYADAVRRDLSLRIDDTTLGLRVLAARYPTVDALTTGTGTIALSLEALLPSRLGRGTLHLTNHHARALSAYMVHCLMPRPPLRVLAQTRTPDQSSYQVDLEFAATHAGAAAGWAAVAVVLLIVGGALVFRGSRRRRRGVPAAEAAGGAPGL